MVHSHPSLRRPITEAQFRAEVASVWRQVRVPFLAMVVFSERLQKRHCRNARSYAEVEIREKEENLNQVRIYNIFSIDNLSYCLSFSVPIFNFGTIINSSCENTGRSNDKGNSQ